MEKMKFLKKFQQWPHAVEDGPPKPDEGELERVDGVSRQKEIEKVDGNERTERNDGNERW